MTNLKTEAKVLLKNLSTRPRKSLGQNFMVKPEVLERVAQALTPKESGALLEIGPGLGFLTEFLLKNAYERIILVEKDRRLAENLQRRYAGNEKVSVVERDILKLDLKKDLKHKNPIQVVGNIPYNITSPVLQWLIEQRPLVEEAVLTTQVEVAERLLAKPNTKEWGALSIFVQFYATVEIVHKINRNSFYPVPKVDSAIVRLVFLKKPAVSVKDNEKFSGVVRRCFQKRRKTLLNALEDKAKGWTKDHLRPILSRVKVDAIRRPETLTLEEWALLSDHL